MNSTNPDKDTRDTVLTRDRWRCARCGKPLDGAMAARLPPEDTRYIKSEGDGMAEAMQFQPSQKGNTHNE